jgi:predicted O-methyltransferase YrrM
MIVSRIRESAAGQFLAYRLGARSAASYVTHAERELLRALAAAQHCVVEVGVFEGSTSVLLARSIEASGIVWLVDPFPRLTIVERLLRISFCESIAKHETRRFGDHVRFVKATSVEASRRTDSPSEVDLVFIDAQHDYESVREDFYSWKPRLKRGGVIAFHDSRPCAARPDLDDGTGSVRFLRELLAGAHGPFELAAEADSIYAIRIPS